MLVILVSHVYILLYFFIFRFFDLSNLAKLVFEILISMDHRLLLHNKNIKFNMLSY